MKRVVRLDLKVCDSIGIGIFTKTFLGRFCITAALYFAQLAFTKNWQNIRGKETTTKIALITQVEIKAHQLVVSPKNTRAISKRDVKTPPISPYVSID